MDITVYNEDLYVAGMFDTIDGTPASGVARYDGMRWHSLGSGVHTTSAYDKDYSFASSLQEYNGALYIGGEFERAGDKVSLNIARWEPKEPTSVDEPPDITTLPNRPLLSQNYPNPFNPGTTISYQLDQPGEVSLTIYNTLGQTVRVLADGFQTVGIHKIYWDGKSSGGHPVASGLYFYRLISSNETETRKMILLK